MTDRMDPPLRPGPVCIKCGAKATRTAQVTPSRVESDPSGGFTVLGPMTVFLCDAHAKASSPPTSARIEMAKRSLREWASAEVERLKGVEIGATSAHLAPQHALWLLDYIDELERASGGRGPA